MVLRYLIEWVDPAIVLLWSQKKTFPLLLKAPNDLSDQDEKILHTIRKKLKRQFYTNGKPELTEYVVTSTTDLFKKKQEPEEWKTTLEKIIGLIDQCADIPKKQHLQANYEEIKIQSTETKDSKRGDNKTTDLKPNKVNSISRLVFPEFTFNFISDPINTELLPSLIEKLDEYASACPKNFHLAISSFPIKKGNIVFNKMFYLQGGSTGKISVHTKLFSSDIDSVYSNTDNATYADYYSIKEYLDNELKKLLQALSQNDSAKIKKGCEQLYHFVLSMPSYPYPPIPLLKAIHNLNRSVINDSKETNQLIKKIEDEVEIFSKDTKKAEELRKKLTELMNLLNLTTPESVYDLSAIKMSCEDLLTRMSDMVHLPEELLEAVKKTLDATQHQFNSNELRPLMEKTLYEVDKFTLLSKSAILNAYMPSALLSTNDVISLGANAKFETEGGIDVALYPELCLDTQTDVARARYNRSFLFQQSHFQKPDPEHSTQILSSASIRYNPASRVSAHVVHADSIKARTSVYSSHELKQPTTHSLQLVSVENKEVKLVGFDPIPVEPTEYRREEVELFRDALINIRALQILRHNKPELNDIISKKIIKEILQYTLIKTQLIVKKYAIGSALNRMLEEYGESNSAVLDAALINSCNAAEFAQKAAHLLVQQIENWVLLDTIPYPALQDLLKAGEVMRTMIEAENNQRLECQLLELTSNEAKQSGYLLIRFIQEGKTSQAIQLLQKGTPANVTDGDGYSALWWAFRMRNASLIMELTRRLDSDATEKIYIGPEKNPEGSNADDTGPVFLVLACTQTGFKDEDKRAIIKTLSENKQLNLEKQTSDGRTLFDLAIDDRKLLSIFLEICPGKIYASFETYADKFLKELLNNLTKNVEAKNDLDKDTLFRHAQLIADCFDKNTPLGKLIDHVHSKRKDLKLSSNQKPISEILDNLKMTAANAIKNKIYNNTIQDLKNTDKNEQQNFINTLLMRQRQANKFMPLLEQLTSSDEKARLVEEMFPKETKNNADSKSDFNKLELEETFETLTLKLIYWNRDVEAKLEDVKKQYPKLKEAFEEKDNKLTKPILSLDSFSELLTILNAQFDYSDGQDERNPSEVAQLKRFFYFVEILDDQLKKFNCTLDKFSSNILKTCLDDINSQTDKIQSELKSDDPYEDKKNKLAALGWANEFCIMLFERALKKELSDSSSYKTLSGS